MPNDSNSPATPEPNAPETGNASGSGSPDILVAITAASKEAETFLQQVRDAQAEEEANYDQLRSDLEGAVNGFQSRVTDITSELRRFRCSQIRCIRYVCGCACCQMKRMSRSCWWFGMSMTRIRAATPLPEPGTKQTIERFS